jgi:hypothetical protein
VGVEGVCLSACIGLRLRGLSTEGILVSKRRQVSALHHRRCREKGHGYACPGAAR